LSETQNFSARFVYATASVRKMCDSQAFSYHLDDRPDTPQLTPQTAVTMDAAPYTFHTSPKSDIKKKRQVHVHGDQT